MRLKPCSVGGPPEGPNLWDPNRSRRARQMEHKTKSEFGLEDGKGLLKENIGKKLSALWGWILGCRQQKSQSENQSIVFAKSVSVSIQLRTKPSRACYKGLTPSASTTVGSLLTAQKGPGQRPTSRRSASSSPGACSWRESPVKLCVELARISGLSKSRNFLGIQHFRIFEFRRLKYNNS